MFEGLGGLGGAGEGVAAGHFDRGVSEDAGDGGQVVALFAEAGGQGVAQGVRPEWFPVVIGADVGVVPEGGDDVACGPVGEPLLAAGEEQGGLRRAVREPAGALVEPGVESVSGGAVEAGDLAVDASFALPDDELGPSGRADEVAQVESDELGDPQPRVEEGQAEGFVAR